MIFLELSEISTLFQRRPSKYDKKLNDDIQKWLKNASPTDLNSFVTKLALEYPNVYQQLRRRFGHLANDEKLVQLKADISDIVNENAWNAFIDDRSSIEIGDQLNSIIHEILAEVPNGNISTAIRELLIIISSITKLLNSLDDSSEAVGQSLDDALDALKKYPRLGLIN